MIEQLIARVFAMRDAAHLAHWQTSSYARHMALGAFYDEIVEKLDVIVEARQSRGLLFKGPLPFQAVKPNPELIGDAIMTDAAWIGQNRSEIANGIPAVLNMVDDLQGIYLTTLYKLRQLS